MFDFLQQAARSVDGSGHLLVVSSVAVFLVLVVTTLVLRRSIARKRKAKLAKSIEDEETVRRIVAKLILTMRQAGEEGLDEEVIFDRDIYRQMKTDAEDLDRLLPRILVELYRIAGLRTTVSERMNLEQFVRYFNERTGANVTVEVD